MPVRTFSSSAGIHKVYENVDASTFQSRVLSPSGSDAETPVLVDFFATWCQPCKLLSPALKKVASQPAVVGGKEVDLVTIDVDVHQEIAQQFKVSAMPTVIAMKNGKVSPSRRKADRQRARVKLTSVYYLVRTLLCCAGTGARWICRHATREEGYRIRSEPQIISTLPVYQQSTSVFTAQTCKLKRDYCIAAVRRIGLQENGNVRERRMQLR